MNKLTMRSRAVALVASGVVAGGVGGVAVAQLGSAAADSSPPNPQSSAPPAAGHGHPRPMMPLALGGRVLHGEATVRAANGVKDVVVQTGTITAVTDSTVTVKSSDDYSATYTVDKTTRIVLNGADGTLSKLQQGDRVRVLAVKRGSSATAKAVFDGVPPRPHRLGMPGLRGGMHPHPGVMPGAPAGMQG